MGRTVYFGLRQDFNRSWSNRDNRPDPVEQSNISALVEAVNPLGYSLHTEGFRFQWPSASEPLACDSPKLGLTSEECARGAALFAAMMKRVSQLAPGKEFFLSDDGDDILPIHIKDGKARLDVNQVREQIDFCMNRAAELTAKKLPERMEGMVSDLLKAADEGRKILKKHGSNPEWQPVTNFLSKDAVKAWSGALPKVDAIKVRGSVQRIM